MLVDFWGVLINEGFLNICKPFFETKEFCKHRQLTNQNSNLVRRDKKPCHGGRSSICNKQLSYNGANRLSAELRDRDVDKSLFENTYVSFV